MDIERLKELKGIAEQLYQDGNVPLTYCDDVLELIDEAITNQPVTKSATTKEVAEAISWAQGMEILYTEKEMPECVNCAKLAITALQAYQPWIPCTERMPTEEDADEDGFVLTLDADQQQTDYPHSEIEAWNSRCDVKITHWRPMLPIPKGE